MNLARPVGRELEGRDIGHGGHPLAAPAGEVGDEHVAAEVQLGLEQYPPAVERYRRRQGKLPASLTDLASPLPADPFTGHDLLYRRTEDGFVVASIGPARATEGTRG